jgi:tRNA(Ile)-lysidine synthetase-like protein
MKLVTPKNLPSGPVIVACSGGVDSVVLAHLLSKALAQAGRGAYDLVLAHVDHGQHAKSATIAKYVTHTLAKKLGSKSEVITLKLPKHSSEEKMRLARLAALNSLADGYKTKEVFFAHHQDDQLETLLFRVLRGTHLQSLKGLLDVNEISGLRIHRPLLAHSKSEIIAYAKKHKLKWFEDPSNTSLAFARNAIRHKLIPLLNELRPKGALKLLRFFEESIQLAEQIKDNQSNHDPRWEVLRKEVLEALGPHAQRTSRSQWDTLRKLLLSSKSDGSKKRAQFPGGIEVIFHRGRANIVRREA